MSRAVTDDGSVFVADDDEAVLADVAVFGGIFHLLTELAVEHGGIIAHLEETVLQRDARIFAIDIGIKGDGAVFLDQFLCAVQQDHELGRLLAGGHIKADMRGIGADSNDAIAVYEIDLGHAVLPGHPDQIFLGCVGRQNGGDFPGGAHQIAV